MLERDLDAAQIDRLDTIIDLLRISLGMPPQYIRDMPERVPGLEYKDDPVTRLLLAASLPSAPAMTEAYIVGDAQRLLARNESQPLMRVDITNDNAAQPLWVAASGVLITTGRMIQQKETVPFVLPMGGELYGITDIPFISVRVSTGYDFYSKLTGMEREDRI